MTVLPLFDQADRPRRELAPGAVHVPGWLTLRQQQELVTACREWARGPVPIRRRVLPGGGVMSVQSVAIGRHWGVRRYTRTADGADAVSTGSEPGTGSASSVQVAEFPDWLADLGRAALAAAYDNPAGIQGAADYRPDAALINFYDSEAKLGMHQDKDERSSAPVVSLSIGDSCVFRFGNTETRTKPYTDIELQSGDLFVFGGPSRFVYHGVPKVHPGTGDPDTGLRSGRLNITMRVTGLRG